MFFTTKKTGVFLILVVFFALVVWGLFTAAPEGVTSTAQGKWEIIPGEDNILTINIHSHPVVVRVQSTKPEVDLILVQDTNKGVVIESIRKRAR